MPSREQKDLSGPPPHARRPPRERTRASGVKTTSAENTICPVVYFGDYVICTVVIGTRGHAGPSAGEILINAVRRGALFSIIKLRRDAGKHGRRAEINGRSIKHVRGRPAAVVVAAVYTVDYTSPRRNRPAVYYYYGRTDNGGRRRRVNVAAAAARPILRDSTRAPPAERARGRNRDPEVNGLNERVDGRGSRRTADEGCEPESLIRPDDDGGGGGGGGDDDDDKDDGDDATRDCREARAR